MANKETSEDITRATMVSLASEIYDICKLTFNRYSKRHAGAKLSDLSPAYQAPIKESLASLSTANPKGVLLVGPPGTGKTHILYAMIREISIMILTREYTKDELAVGLEDFKSGGADYSQLAGSIARSFYEPFCWRSHFELNTELREWGESPGLYSPTTLGSKFLFIDDLGRGHDDKAGWNRALQQELFDYRWRQMLPCFVTTNYAPISNIRNWLGMEMIMDRLCDPDYMITVVMNDQTRRK